MQTSRSIFQRLQKGVLYVQLLWSSEDGQAITINNHEKFSLNSEPVSSKMKLNEKVFLFHKFCLYAKTKT